MESRVAPDTAEWPVWSTLARVVVTDPAALREAHALVTAHLAAVDAAASRFRPDSEINRLPLAAGRPQPVSPLLAELIEAALGAARQTDGDVDPTHGNAIADLGYDRDIDALRGTAGAVPSRGVRVIVRAVPGWRQVRLEGRMLSLPPEVALDLGATAKAMTADRCAALVAERLGIGVLVSLGGDIATAGPGPQGGWQVRVSDGEGEPSCTIGLPAGAAIATSSTLRRRWRLGERTVHHILDPATGQPAEPVWRTVTVAAATCLAANTLTTAAMVRGRYALSWLRSTGVPARLVAADGDVITFGGWPVTEQPAAPRPVPPSPRSTGQEVAR